MKYDPNTPWGGTDTLNLPAPSLTAPPPRNYGDVAYRLPDLAAFRALDHSPLDTQEDTDAAPQARPLTRRLLGALMRPLTRLSAGLDGVTDEYDPARPEAAPNATFHLRLAGFPLPAGMPEGWALAFLRCLPELIPVGRAETYLRVAEIVYGRGSRRVSYNGEERTQSAFTARGVHLHLTDAQLGGDGGGRVLRVAVAGPVGLDFIRLLEALAPATFTARPQILTTPDPLLPYGG